LTQRVSVIRNDEIGSLSRSFNKMADTIYLLINHLETTVKERTTELEKINNELKENKDWHLPVHPTQGIFRR
jgi:two-component system sensor histidine kinase/response regulator